MNVEHIYEDFDWPINLFSSVCVFLITGSLNEINGKIKWLTNKKKRAFCPLFLFNLKFYYSDLSESIIIGVEPSEIIILVFGDFESSWKTSKLFHSMF